eukprot:5133236-Pyramimonas_sp.AAC.1
MDGGLSKRGSRLSAARVHSKHVQELHGLMAGRFQNVALVFAPQTFHGLRADRFQNVAHALPPPTFVLKTRKHFTD